jgi:hypothetical protein
MGHHLGSKSSLVPLIDRLNLPVRDPIKEVEHESK